MARFRRLYSALALVALVGLASAAPASALDTTSTTTALPSVPAATGVAPGSRPSAGTKPHSPSGVTISPAFQQITIGQNEASKDAQVKLTNNTGEPVEFSISVTDFGSLDETGGVLFIGKDQKSLDYRYGLTSWLSLQQDRVVVDPKTTKSIPFTIDNKESMAPGGHYGALMVTPVETDEDPTKVDINQILTSLLFVKKDGGDVYRLGLENVSVHRSLLSAPNSISLRFQNGGNVHVIPRGVLTVTDPRGYQIKQGVINDGSAIILPQAFRRLDVPLLNLGRAWLPGRYHLQIAYRYEGESSVQYYNTSFYYMNGWYVIAAVFLLAVLIGSVLSRRLRRAIGWPARSSGRWFRRIRLTTRRKRSQKP